MTSRPCESHPLAEAIEPTKRLKLSHIRHALTDLIQALTEQFLWLPRRRLVIMGTGLGGS